MRCALRKYGKLYCRFQEPWCLHKTHDVSPLLQSHKNAKYGKEIKKGIKKSLLSGENPPTPLKYQIMSKLWEGFRCCRLWLYIHVQLDNILGSILKLSFDPLRTSYPLGSGLTQYWKCQDSSCSESNLDKFSQEQLFRQYFKLI